MAEYRRRNKARIQAQAAQYYHANRPRILARQTAYYQANREHVRAKQAELYRSNPTPYIARAERRQRNLEQHPAWDPELNELVFAEAYDLVSRRQVACPVDGGWHLDHTVPLRHRNACGLHNAWNIQVVPAKWNLAKGNRSVAKFWPTADPWTQYTRPQLTARKRRAISRPRTTAKLSQHPSA